MISISKQKQAEHPKLIEANLIISRMVDNVIPEDNVIGEERIRDFLSPPFGPAILFGAKSFEVPKKWRKSISEVVWR